MEYNDDIIRGILMERKRRALRKKRIINAIADMLGWIGIFGGAYMLYLLMYVMM